MNSLEFLPEPMHRPAPCSTPQRPHRVTRAEQREKIESTVQVTPAPYVTVKLAAVITGLTETAIRRKIDSGKWIEGREYRRSPDGGLFISIKGYERWVEKAAG